MPHLEHPKLRDEPSLRISFLEEQTVQSACTVFTTKLSYTFEDWQGEYFSLPRFWTSPMLTSSRLRAVPGAHPGRKTRFYRRHRRSKIQRPRGGMHQPESTDLPRIQRETGHAVFRQLAAQGAKAICVDSWYGGPSIFTGSTLSHLRNYTDTVRSKLHRNSESRQKGRSTGGAGPPAEL